MFFGLTIEKVLVIAVIAAIVIGPERIPRYAEGLARFTQRAREFVRGARSRMKDEMGQDFDDVDWKKLDPRQYDPRRIIREALLDDAVVKPRAATAMTTAPTTPLTGATTGPDTAEAAPKRPSTPTFTTEGRPPFDAEAT